MLGNSLLFETLFSNQTATSAVLKCCTGSDFITPQEFTSQRTLQALDTTTSTLHLNNLFLSLCRRHSLFIKSWDGENCRTAVSQAFSCFPLPSLKRKADVESIFLPLNPPLGRIRWGELKEGNKKPKPLCVCVCALPYFSLGSVFHRDLSGEFWKCPAPNRKMENNLPGWRKRMAFGRWGEATARVMLIFIASSKINTPQAYLHLSSSTTSSRLLTVDSGR